MIRKISYKRYTFDCMVWSCIIDIFKRSASSVRYFRDGRPITAGFLLSDEPVAEDRW